MSTMRWGISSTGSIAAKMVETLAAVDGADVVAAGSRSKDAATAFADRFGITRAHGSYDALLADDDVDIVYVASPHHAHHRMTIDALDAGKHVLCEKAFALDQRQASEMVEAARRNDRFLMEAMWSWFMPGWHELRRRLQQGAIGDVVSLDANFCLRIDDPDGRHHRADLGGGALLDLGIYPLSLARFLLGEPADLESDVAALGILNDDGVDRRLAGSVRHRSGALTTFSTSLDATSDLSARITGTAGTIEIAAPFWFPSSFEITPIVDRLPGASEIVHTPHRGLAHEVEHAMERIRAGHVESDVQTWDATLANMALLDEIRRQVGVDYGNER